MLWFRNADTRFPFLHESSAQVPARWHGAGAGPAQYLADTADGAWAEFLRHEEISDPRDLAGISRNLWAVEVTFESETVADVGIDVTISRGGLDSYAVCQSEATRLRADGATALAAPSAALRAGGACGQQTRAGQLTAAPPADGQTLVLFGTRPDARGWLCAAATRPSVRALSLVNAL